MSFITLSMYPIKYKKLWLIMDEQWSFLWPFLIFSSFTGDHLIAIS